jgi:hypothetical protein
MLTEVAAAPLVAPKDMTQEPTATEEAVVATVWEIVVEPVNVTAVVALAPFTCSVLPDTEVMDPVTLPPGAPPAWLLCGELVELDVGVLLVDEHPVRMIDPAARTAKMMLPRLTVADDGLRITFSCF